MNRKLDVGGTLSQVFSTYGQQAGVLLPLAFGLFLLVAIITGLFAGNFLLGWLPSASAWSRRPSTRAWS